MEPGEETDYIGQDFTIPVDTIECIDDETEEVETAEAAPSAL